MDRLYINHILKQLEESRQITYAEGFAYARACSGLLFENEEAHARKIAIRILNHWHEMDSNLYPLWSELMESLGFYPYLNGREPGLANKSLDDAMRQCYHESSYLPSVTLHSDQKRISDLIFSGKNVVLSAPTSYGKSLLIEEIVASHKYHNIVVIQPTLALLDETRIKMLKYSNSYRLIVRTTQAYDAEGDNIFLLTAERVVEYEEFPRIDFLIIDEFYKISYARDDERVDVLNNAFMRIYYEHHPQFYFLGPNIMTISPTFERDFEVEFIRTDYSLVDSYEEKGSEPNDTRPEKLAKLFQLLASRPKDEQTLVYCSSPEKARNLSLFYYEYLTDKRVTPRYKESPLVEWIKKEISDKWTLAKELEYGIAIHDASIPKHIGGSIIRYFNHHQLDVIFCTPTIIEGVNTSAKNVVVFSDKKGGNKLDFFDYSNIKGRAGRLMEHYVGRVYTFISEPPQKELSIDMPFADQQDNLKNEVLINIPPDKVKPQHRERYEKLQKIPADLLVIIKRNGISVSNQIQLVKTVQEYLKSRKGDFLWKQIPKYNELQETIDLLWQCKILCKDDKVLSSKQLTLYLSKYNQNKTIIKFFHFLQGDGDQNYDKNLEKAFAIQRRWFQYYVPKALRVGESIINYVCGKQMCSYSYYAQLLETNFLPSNLSILLEYGIPTITIRKLRSHIPENLTEEEVVKSIKEHQELTYLLLPYERDLIENNL